MNIAERQTTHTNGCFFPSGLMDEVRARFYHADHCPVTNRRRIFFENGGGSLKLRQALAANAEIAALPDQEGRNNPASQHLSAVINRGRDDLALFFGADDGQVISGETGTGLIYALVRAVALSAAPGPVMSSNLEHPASFDAARQWAGRTSRPWLEVRLDPYRASVSAEDYAEKITPDTRIATVIHTSQLTGFRLDLAAISAAIRAVAPDCYIIVDGIQHAPHGAVAVRDYGVDAYVFSPYKAYSRLAVGFAWLGPRMVQVPHEHMLGKSAEVWELGSRDPGIYAAHSAVVDYFCWLGANFVQNKNAGRPALLAAGAAAMAAHEHALLQLLLSGNNEAAGLSRIEGVTVIGPPELDAREGLVSFNLRGISSPQLVARLDDYGIRVHARTNDAYSGHILSALSLPDCLRVSLCHYNTPDEVLVFLKALAEIAGSVR